MPASLTAGFAKEARDLDVSLWHEADEAFAAYYVARYVNAVAEAGKREYPLPFYANVWLREQKNFMRPGEAYPSGGGTLNMLDIWKALTPSLDAVAPDNYVLDYVNYQPSCMATGEKTLFWCRRPAARASLRTFSMHWANTTLWAMRFFGLDLAADGAKIKDLAQPFADDCALLGPAVPFIAEWQGTGKLHAAVEEENLTERLISSSAFDVLVQFGNAHPEYGGTFGTQTPKKSGRVLVAELAPDELVAIGFDARVDFRPARGRSETNAQFLRAEEGTFVDGVWKTTHVLNGDETFFGIRLPARGRHVEGEIDGVLAGALRPAPDEREQAADRGVESLAAAFVYAYRL